MDDSSMDDVFDPAEIVTFPADAVPRPGPDGMKVAWGGKADILVFCEGKDGRFPLTQKLCRQLHDDIQLDVCRDMLQRFHSIFMNLQSAVNSLKSGGFEGSEVRRRHEVFTASRSYFETMFEAVTQLESQAKSSGLGLEKAAELRRMLMVWHLTHLLFIVSVRGCSAQKYLREWIAFHTIVPETKGNNFWDVLMRLLLIGDIDTAVKELQLHRAKEARAGRSTQGLDLLGSILRTMPLFDENDSMVRRHEWTRWREQLDGKRSEFMAGNIPTDVFDILSGNQDVLQRRARTWYEYGVAYLIYINPLSRASNLSELVDDWFAAMGTEENDFDAVLAAVFEFDAAKLLTESVNCFKSAWFTAHLADILAHIGTFGINDTLRYGSDLREWFLLEYGTQLMEVGQSMWMFGSNYLKQCPEFGTGRLATTIARVPFETAAEAQRLITTCQLAGLTDMEKRICITMGTKQWRRRRYCDALLWYIQSGDRPRIHRAADKLIDLCINGTQQDREEVQATLEPLSRGDDFGPRLSFLLQYNRLRAAVDAQEHARAAQILTAMFDKGMVPLQYRHRLLFNDDEGRYDALSVISAANDIVFKVNDTNTLLRCLENLRASPSARPWEVKMPIKTDRVMQLRQALAQNLARALLSH